eukprot:877596-Pelagomonas_calceolata.AAC.7
MIFIIASCQCIQCSFPPFLAFLVGHLQKRRARRGVPISGRAAALALQRKEEQKAALAHAKAVEDHKEVAENIVQAFCQTSASNSSSKIRAQKVATPHSLTGAGLSYLSLLFSFLCKCEVPWLLPSLALERLNQLNTFRKPFCPRYRLYGCMLQSSSSDIRCVCARKHVMPIYACCCSATFTPSLIGVGSAAALPA